jgi:acyl-coenzyme A synthetase/AMP-(fatty) acid ligase
LKELINRGGEKISPNEIDALLLQHDSVIEACTFAVPDSIFGKEINAAVVLKDRISAEELKAWMGHWIADFKVPKQIFITKELPQTATGKIQRRFVAEAFLKKASL